MIVSGQMLYDEPVDADGLLVIGDPHVTSRRPGRRRDTEWPTAVLRKLEHCVEVANERRLYPVFLGDMFEYAKETDEALKTRLIRILKRFWVVPLTNVGNHDIEHTRLSEGDTLAMLAVSDVIDAVAESGPVCVFNLKGKKLGVGMTPYGQEIPTDVSGLFPGVDGVAWFTHHDIAMQENYPGAVRPFEIVGAKLAINGHIHANKMPERAGSTLWLNPGTITRNSVDLIEHVPRAWELKPQGRLDPVDLPHEADVFDLTGKLIEAATTAQVAQSLESAFVSMLQAETTGEMRRSGDGAVMREEILAKFEAEDTPPDVRAIITSLLDEVVASAPGA